MWQDEKVIEVDGEGSGIGDMEDVYRLIVNGESQEGQQVTTREAGMEFQATVE